MSTMNISRNDAMKNLVDRINSEEEPASITFDEFLNLTNVNPNLYLRSIFQLFNDMMHYYVDEGKELFPGNPDFSFKMHDLTKLLVDGADNAFFSDRYLAGNLMSIAKSFRHGNLQNQMYVFKGSPGSGKTTFLNNLLNKFEEYSCTDAGLSYELLWQLDKSVIKRGPIDKNGGKNVTKYEGILEVPCPSHDHPLLIIPKSQRPKFLEDLIKDESFKKKVFHEKQYEWLFKGEACTICTSIYQALSERLGSADSVFDMIFAKKRKFSRKTGTGISVYNASDVIPRENSQTNETLQQALSDLFEDSNKIRYKFSQYAKTNEGILALMDIKEQNIHRMKALHGIISDGVHKVEDIEERVNSLFLAIINPEDEKQIYEISSFKDRVKTIQVPYVLNYDTEVKIYKKIFGESIEQRFLPRVLVNFAKIIASTRIKVEEPQKSAFGSSKEKETGPSATINYWLKDNPSKYQKFCDKNHILLRLDLFRDIMPKWISDEDKKSYTPRLRRALIAEMEPEGNCGITGRESVKIFDAFMSRYGKKDQPITMAMVKSFMSYFLRLQYRQDLPQGVLETVISHYNLEVIEEVKSSLYRYNVDQVSRDIQNYMFALSYPEGTKIKCNYTGEDLRITNEFFDRIEMYTMDIWGILDDNSVMTERKDQLRRYVADTLTKEMNVEGKKIYETQQYRELLQKYTDGLKQNILSPLQNNKSFRAAISAYGEEKFKTFDDKIKRDVDFLLTNLNKNYSYSPDCAKQLCLYVIDDVLKS